MEDYKLGPPTTAPRIGDVASPTMDAEAFSASFTDVLASLQLDFPQPLDTVKEGFGNGTSGTVVFGTDPNMTGQNTDLSKGGSGFGVAASSSANSGSPK